MPSRCCTTISHLLALLVFTFLNLSRAQDLSSTQVHLTPISHDGPLCPPESSILKTSIISVPGNTTHLIHHTLPYFRPPIAPNIPAASQRAHCHVLVNVTFSEPRTMAILNYRGMDIRGYLPLEPLHNVRFSAIYEWVGLYYQAHNELWLTGPSPEPFTKRFGTEWSDREINSPCEGGMLRVRYDLRAATSNPPATREFPVMDEETERWEFGSSLDLGRC